MSVPLPFRQSFQDLVRLRHIAQVLVRNGLGFIIEQLGLARLLNPGRRSRAEEEQGPGGLSIPERVRHTLEELGPTYVKLGQLMSTRPDVFPPAFISELSKLQDAVPPFSTAQAVQRIEQELGRPLDILFAEFDPVPVASASIGQVHYAKLHTGERVVVKVQRPGIRVTIESDLDLILRQARFLEARSSILREYELVQLVEEFGLALQDELDYVREGRNAERISQVLVEYDNVAIPCIFWDLTTPRVITMEDMRGIKVNDLVQLEAKGYDAGAIAKLIVNVYYHQVFIDGLFHADPHPANIIIHDDDISLVDFGLVGFLSRGVKEDLRDLFLALLSQEVEQITDIVLHMGAIDRATDRKRLERDIQRLLHRYYGITLENVSMGEFLKEITQVAFSHRIRLPSDLALLARTLIVLEGLVLTLDPNFNMVEFARPFVRRLLSERISLKRWGQEALLSARDYGKFLTSFPDQATSILDQVANGDLTVGFEVRRLGQVMRRVDAIANRLAFSIVVAALIVGSGLVIRAGTESLIWHIPLLGWSIPIAQIIFFAAGILGAGLLVSILRARGL